MVYITGDIHGDPRDLLRFSEAHSLTADDTIIILGDTGFNFYLHGRDRKAKKLAARIPATLLFMVELGKRLRPSLVVAVDA